MERSTIVQNVIFLPPTNHHLCHFSCSAPDFAAFLISINEYAEFHTFSLVAILMNQNVQGEILWLYG